MKKKQLSKDSIRVSTKFNPLKIFLICCKLNHSIILMIENQRNKVYKYIVGKISILLRRKIKLL